MPASGKKKRKSVYSIEVRGNLLNPEERGSGNQTNIKRPAAKHSYATFPTR
jgi:hypothetical protein